jgi:DNA-binding HxlR family transcriptional regulator
MQDAQRDVPVDVFSAACPSRTVLDIIGARWTVLIIGAMEDGPRRFGELERAAGGISAKVLTQVLRSLERDGLVTRRVFAEVPPHTEYALTPLGRDLVGPLKALRDWSEANVGTILESRERADAALATAAE